MKLLKDDSAVNICLCLVSCILYSLFPSQTLEYLILYLEIHYLHRENLELNSNSRCCTLLFR